MLFTKPKKAVGVDIGSHSVKVILMARTGGRARVEQVGYALVDRNLSNMDPIQAQADALSLAVQTMPLAQALVVGALPGQTVVIRYPRFDDIPSAQIEAAIQREAGQNIPYDLAEVFLDWYLLDTVQEGESTKLKVLLVAAKHEVIDTRVQIADSAGVEYGVLGVDSLALADAMETCEMMRTDETVALINLGASSTSIHFTRDGVSNFIRDVSWGARELVTAISKTRRCDYEEAQHLMLHGEPQPVSAATKAGETPAESAESQPASAEPFGGPSYLDPLDDELDGLGDMDASPASESEPIVGGGESQSLDQILSTPLARLVSEVRRSFDFYEQQLYERPVDRIILSGGAAHLGLIRDLLADELGIEHVEVADPTASGLLFGRSDTINTLREQPAQFMVAIGLAARGMAEL